MTDFPIPKECRSDFLFLLVGTNPLPNYVAVRLLAQPNATVYLLHSDGEGSPSTKPIAEQLETCLCEIRSDLDIKVKGISETNNVRIKNALEPLLQCMAKRNPASCVGLHYTGGTKPMAVHVYGLVRQFFPDAVFSYLDPRRLALQVDGRRTDSNVTSFFLAKEAGLRAATEMDMDQLAALHGYVQDKRPAEWASPDQTPGLMDVCHSIARVWGSPDSVDPWLCWLNHNRLQILPNGAPGTPLHAVRIALESMCHAPGGTTPASVAKILRPYDEKKLTLANCDLWFRGLWLEELTDDAVKQIAQELPIRPAPLRCWYKAGNGEFFELDAAFMYGYQLFAISCIATDRKGNAKEHLFEAYVRARQLGGDEARVGLVCCMDNTRSLQEEIERTWDAKGKVWVFGRDQLSNLPDALKDWVKTANP